MIFQVNSQNSKFLTLKSGEKKEAAFLSSLSVKNEKDERLSSTSLLSKNYSSSSVSKSLKKNKII